jgi:putative transposase
MPMSHSLFQIYVHIVFSTKNRINYLCEPKIGDELYAYIAGILKNVGSEPLIVNGMSYHIHILCTLPRSSSWIKTKKQN